MATGNENTLRVRLTVGQTSFEAEGPPEEVRELYEQFRNDIEARIPDAAGKRKTPADAQGPKKENDTPTPDPDASDAHGENFFAKLSEESGVSIEDLEQVLHLHQDSVEVTPPNRKLGETGADQARTVIALVAGARHAGFGEPTVAVAAVRDELKRKRLYDSGNFSSKHVGALEGVNKRGRDTLLFNSKWVGEFKAAVEQVAGGPDEPSEQP